MFRKLRTAGGSLKGFAEILGFEYSAKRAGGRLMKVAHCDSLTMQKLLDIES